MHPLPERWCREATVFAKQSGKCLARGRLRPGLGEGGDGRGRASEPLPAARCFACCSPFPAGFRAEKPGTAEIKSLAAAWTHLLRSAAKQLGAASLPGLLGGTRGALEQEAPEAGRWAEGLAGT